MKTGAVKEIDIPFKFRIEVLREGVRRGAPRTVKLLISEEIKKSGNLPRAFRSNRKKWNYRTNWGVAAK